MFALLKEVWTWLWGARDTLLELVIVAMIGWEIHEGNLQYTLLEKMNQNAADNVVAIKELRREQADSAKGPTQRTNQAPSIRALY